MDRTHPALHFPFYVVGGALDGPRWLAGVDGPLGHPAEGVWVGHGGERREQRRPWAHVGTYRRDAWPGPGSDQDERPAYRAVLCVVDATMPDPSVVPDDRRHELLAVAETRAADGGWQPCSWQLGGIEVDARVFPWAGAWAGFTTAHPDLDVVVLAHDVEPDGLVLDEVTDGHTVHVDLGAPVVFPDTTEASRAAAGLDPDGDRPWWPAHPDHAVRA